MLTPQAAVHLPFTQDLAQAGVAYTCRWLVNGHTARHSPVFSSLRFMVAEKAALLAFERYLVAKKIPHRLATTTPFNRPNLPDLILGGRRWRVNPVIVSQPETIRKIQASPEHLLSTPVQVSLVQPFDEPFSETDVHLVAFVLGRFALHLEDTRRAHAAGLTIHLVHPLPHVWHSPKEWNSLGSLKLNCESDDLVLELGGLGRERQFISENIPLSPGVNKEADQVFYTLAYASTNQIPSGKTYIYSPGLNKGQGILPHQWGNIWIYGIEIILAGFLTRRELLHIRQGASQSIRESPFPSTRSGMVSIPASQLHPLGEFLDLVKTARS